MEMSERIKAARTAKGLTQEELGKLIGVQKAAINKYENGSVENLKRSVIQKLSDALDVSPIYLLGYSDNPKGVESNSRYNKSLHSLFEKLDETDKIKVTAFIEGLLAGDKYSYKAEIAEDMANVLKVAENINIPQHTKQK